MEIFIDPPSSPVSRPGDVWELGHHRLLCGDSTKPEHVSDVMAGAHAAIYLTDPPYNVSYTGGSTKERRAIANDSMPAESFEAFLTSAFTAADAHMSPGSAFYIWHASKALLEFVSACEAACWPVRQTLIWVKNSFTLSRRTSGDMSLACTAGSRARRTVGTATDRNPPCLSFRSLKRATSTRR